MLDEYQHTARYQSKPRVKGGPVWSMSLDFSKLRWGDKTITDIDGLLNFDGKAFVLIEAKY